MPVQSHRFRNPIGHIHPQTVTGLGLQNGPEEGGVDPYRISFMPEEKFGFAVGDRQVENTSARLYSARIQRRLPEWAGMRSAVCRTVRQQHWRRKGRVKKQM